MKVTREKVLRDALEMAIHNMYCYSKNWGGNVPKEGHEKEHAEATAEVKILETWLKEFNYTSDVMKKLELSEREQHFAMYVISEAVNELKDYQYRTNQMENNVAGFTDDRTRGYSYGQHNATRTIAGSSLSALFGGMGIHTITALEKLAKRDDIHTFCPAIIEEYYGELCKCWNDSD